MNKLHPPIGILGGTFDPIHQGHIHLALELLSELKFECIKFLPCYQPVHRSMPVTTPEDRVQMIKIAIKDQPQLSLDLREIERAGPSYMIDTLISLRNELPNTPLCLILGLDSFNHIDTWKCWKELLVYAHFIVVNRPSVQLTQNSDILKIFEQHQINDKRQLSLHVAGGILFVNIVPSPISATEIRHRIQAKLPVAQLLPHGVAEYIHDHDLYEVS